LSYTRLNAIQKPTIIHENYQVNSYEKILIKLHTQKNTWHSTALLTNHTRNIQCQSPCSL